MFPNPRWMIPVILLLSVQPGPLFADAITDWNEKAVCL